MGGYNVILFLLPIILLLLVGRRRMRTAITNRILKRKGERAFMEELAKRFIDKECIISILAEWAESVNGVVKEVGKGGILIETPQGEQLLNLDYVTRIREYPRKKKDKKKSNAMG